MSQLYSHLCCIKSSPKNSTITNCHNFSLYHVFPQNWRYQRQWELWFIRFQPLTSSWLWPSVNTLIWKILYWCSQQVSHQRWISGIHGMQVTKHASEGSTLALKPRGDVIRSPKQGYQRPHKKDSCPPKNFKKRKKDPILVYIITDYELKKCNKC